MRDGIACGLIMISGFIPSLVKGIFSSGNIMPITPFCPCLDACLSPNSGLLIFKNRTLHILVSSSLILLSIKTLSTLPNNELSVVIEQSV